MARPSAPDILRARMGQHCARGRLIGRTAQLCVPAPSTDIALRPCALHPGLHIGDMLSAPPIPPVPVLPRSSPEASDTGLAEDTEAPAIADLPEARSPSAENGLFCIPASPSQKCPAKVNFITPLATGRPLSLL